MLCPRTKKWIKKGKCAGDKMPLYFDVDGLEEGQEYNFRVKAINDEGESDPLEGDKPIIAKNPFGEYMSSFLGYRQPLQGPTKFYNSHFYFNWSNAEGIMLGCIDFHIKGKPDPY